ncbi:dynein heavy chain family protein [Cystoisospora suis]|uniref:Dynein heavy chain family protein n=1 Tax=Cystoisospora suis TaxID=483139 RepID=A0A2C6L9T3_9APIC|nr:dynein heavy chain family protein [Cystoisospora suis]
MSNAEAVKTRKRIQEFEGVVTDRLKSLKNNRFYFFQTGVEQSKENIQEVQATVSQFNNTVEELMTLAESFGDVSELDPTKQGIESILEELDAVEVFWNYTSQALHLLEELLNTPWGKVDAPTIEQDIKTLQKGLKDLKVSLPPSQTSHDASLYSYM